MKNKNKWGKYLLSLLLSLCIVGGMLPVVSMANGLSGDATLQSLYYHINGGDPISVPDFDPEKAFYPIKLPRSTPRDAEITLSGECTNEKASITQNTGITLEKGIALSTADIIVTAEDGSTAFYFVYCDTELIIGDLQEAAVEGIESEEVFLQNEMPVFTAIGSGMENADPVMGDIRYRPASWKIDNGEVLSGNWTDEPFTAVLELSKLSGGTHILTVTYELDRFMELEENQEPTGIYGWSVMEMEEGEPDITVSFSVTEVPAAEHTVTFDSCGGSVVSPLNGVQTGTTIAAPDAPVKDGFTFGGWYKDTNCTDIWNFNTDVVTADITLYAKWSIEEPTTDGSEEPTTDGSEEPTTDGSEEPTTDGSEEPTTDGSEESTTDGSEETTTDGDGSEEPTTDGDGSEENTNSNGKDSEEDKNSGKGNAEDNANSGTGSESGSNPKTGALGLPAVIPLLAIASCLTGCLSIRRRRNTQ